MYEQVNGRFNSTIAKKKYSSNSEPIFERKNKNRFYNND